MTPRIPLLIALLACALIAAGCGSDDEPADTSSTTGVETGTLADEEDETTSTKDSDADDSDSGGSESGNPDSGNGTRSPREVQTCLERANRKDEGAARVEAVQRCVSDANAVKPPADALEVCYAAADATADPKAGREFCDKQFGG